MSKGDLIPVPLGMWFSTLLLIPICIFLSYKATIDSSIFSIEEQFKWLSNLKIVRYFNSKANEDTSTMS